MTVRTLKTSETLNSTPYAPTTGQTTYTPLGSAAQGLAPAKMGKLLAAGSAGSFYAALVESPAFFYDSTRRMWGMVFVGYTQASGSNGGTSAGVESSIGLAWFSNGLDQPPVVWGQILAKSANSYDVSGVTAPFVWIEGGVVYLYYAGLTATGYEGGTPTLCLATASDIQTAPAGWTRSNLNPIIGTSAAGTGWRSAKVFHPFLLKNGSTYYMFLNASGNVGGTTTERIGYATATSPAGPFTCDDTNSPILSPSTSSSAWDAKQVGDPCVRALPDGSFVMDYYGVNNANTAAGDGVATASAAGFPTTWTKSALNPVLQPGAAGSFDSTYAHKPGTALINGVLLHGYTADDGTHRSIGLAVDSGVDPQAVHTTQPTIITAPSAFGTVPFRVATKTTDTRGSTVTFGDEIGPTTVSGRAKVVVGNSSGVSEFLIGQDNTHMLVASWNYNATVGSATAEVSTYGGSNRLILQNSTGDLLVGGNSGGKVGFLGTAPISKQTLAAAATDPTTTMALANDIRSKIIALGLTS